MFHYDFLFNMHTYKQTLCVETTGDVLLRSALFSAAGTGHLTPTHFKLISSSIKNDLCCANSPTAIIHFLVIHFKLLSSLKEPKAEQFHEFFFSCISPYIISLMRPLYYLSHFFYIENGNFCSSLLLVPIISCASSRD